MKLAYRILKIAVLVVGVVALLHIGYQLKRLNDFCDNVRSEIPMSLLGQ